MQYKVPQHVDIEDKVIGSLTIRQFVIVLVGVAIIGVLKLVLVGPLSFLFWPIALVLGLIVGGIAFAKYGDQNMEVFLLSAVKTFISPRKRVWQKEPVQPEAKSQQPVVPETQAPADTRIGIEHASGGLEKLAEVVDSGGYSIFEKKGIEAEAPDLLARTEGEAAEVDAMLEEATKVAPKRESLVSEAASVAPDPKQTETPKIILRKDQFYKDIK